MLLNNPNERSQFLGSRVFGSVTHDYFSGDDLYVYQFNGSRKIGYLCTLDAWERVFSKMEGLQLAGETQ